MTRSMNAGALVLCLGLAAGCGRGNDEAPIAEQDPQVEGRGADAPALVTARGCLTASGDRFVLTELERGAAGEAAREPGDAGTTASAQPTTESYQLIGDADELRKLVGRQVEVSGAANPPRVAEVREMTPPTEPGSATGTTGAPTPPESGEPRVATTTETRLEVTQLRVEALSDTGQPCVTTGREPR